MRLSRPPGLAAAACFATVVSVCAVAQPPGNYENAPELAGGSVAPTSLLSGPLHGVAEPIAIENFFGRFEIDSQFGKFRVAGVNLLGVRVRELAAIQALNEVNRSEAFQQALARSAQAPVQFVGNAFMDPAATVENVASGFGTVLGRVGRLATTGALAVGDTASDLVRPGANAPPSVAPTEEPAPTSFTGDPFGFNKARREWAKSLNIDPYTTNPVLRRRLDEVAQATFAGNFAVNATVGLVVAPLQYAASFDTVVRDSVWNMPVVDLVAQNERKLRAMGIAGRPVRDFFRNRWFTPTLQTALVVALERLPKVRGRDAVIATATGIQGEARVRSLIGAVNMIAERHHDKPLKSIRMSGIVAIGGGADGELVVACDLDYVWWNAEAAEFAARSDLAAKHRTLLVSGVASDRATRELARAGWEVRTGLRSESKD